MTLLPLSSLDSMSEYLPLGPPLHQRPFRVRNQIDMRGFSWRRDAHAFKIHGCVYESTILVHDDALPLPTVPADRAPSPSPIIGDNAYFCKVSSNCNAVGAW